MSGESTDRVHNGIPYTNHQTAVMNGNQDPNKDLSKSPSCLADGDSYNPESVMALRNAYSILRDRYNKLKLEHQKLQKQLQKVIVPSSKQKSQISNSKAELNNSLKELAGPHISGDEPLSTGTLISELEQLRERLDKLSREALSHVDTDLKGMMENVIPKLRELERQCSSLSEEDPRSLILFCSRKTQVKSICDEKFISQKTSEDIPGKQESIFHTPNQSLSEDFLPSSDLSDSSLYQSKLLQPVMHNHFFNSFVRYITHI